MKYTKIYSESKDKNTGAKVTNKSFISDEIIITKFQNPNDAYKVYLQKKKQGHDCTWKRGVIQETHKNKKKAELVKMTMKEQEKLKEHYIKTMDIKYWKEEVEA